MAAISAAAIIALLYHFNYLPHPRYSGQAFGIDTYVSTVDMDRDGIDDQSDILLSAREYVSQRPRYKSVYYGSGYPDDQYGVCTDVVAFGALGAGYDLMELDVYKRQAPVFHKGQRRQHHRSGHTAGALNFRYYFYQVKII